MKHLMKIASVALLLAPAAAKAQQPTFAVSTDGNTEECVIIGNAKAAEWKQVININCATPLKNSDSALILFHCDPPTRTGGECHMGDVVVTSTDGTKRRMSPNAFMALTPTR